MRAIVTGANRGIGLALCTLWTRQGHEVAAVCRRTSPALNALNAEVITDIDQSQPDSIEQLADRLGARQFDSLVHVAGVLARQSLGSIEESGIEGIHRQFSVNAVGPLLMTQALLPNLSSGSKIAIITSRMGSMGDNSSGGSYGYRMSKAAVNAAGVSLAHDLRGEGIAVAILHPGYVRTDMTGGSGLIDVDESAAGISDRIQSLSLDNSGTFWHINGEILPW